MFGDDQTIFPRLATERYHQGTGMVPDRQVVQALGIAHAIGTAKVSRRDYDFERPALCLNAQGRHETRCSMSRTITTRQAFIIAAGVPSSVSGPWSGTALRLRALKGVATARA